MESPKVYTPDEARKILKIGKSRMYELLRSEKIKAIRNGRRYLIPESSLIEYINSQTNDSDAKAGDAPCRVRNENTVAEAIMKALSLNEKTIAFRLL